MTTSSELSAMVAELKALLAKATEAGAALDSGPKAGEIYLGLAAQYHRAQLDLQRAAINALPTLLADLETMQAALEPFAKALDDWGDDERHADERDLYDHPTSCNITLGDLRAARGALQPRKAKP